MRSALRRLLAGCPIAIAAAMLAWPAPAEAPTARIRAVFVGIDKYRYSETNVPGAGFKDLRGAVGDAGRIKAALRAAYRLDLDEPAPGQCKSANAVSITLTDDCADREAIMGALDQQIAASAPGDTLLFYYAGHGSQFIDDQAFDQASGYNDTILPTDAREPGATSKAEILDREMLEVVNRATRRGINVVTIFDSCNSGSATRDVLGGTVPRSVPPLRAAPGTARPATVGSSLQGPGYRVHLAAAADGESALEAGSVGERAGVFTQALASTLLAMPQASFADIDAEVRLKVEELGHARQHPQASGALQATLGGGARQVPLLDANVDGTGFLLQGGLLSGVTEGSTYALFGSTSDALNPEAKPVATGRVSTVAASVSTLVPDRPRDAAAAPLPRRLVARETAHAFGQRFVQVRNAAPAGERQAQVERAIAAIPVARLAEPAQLTIAAAPAGATTLGLYAQDGRLLAALGDPSAAGFGTNLARELGKVARVQALLALRTAPAADDVRFCIATGTYDPYDCPAAAAPAAAGGLRGAPNEARLKAGEATQVTVVNASDRRRFVYVLGIDEDYSVTLLLPADGGTDPALGPRQPLQRSDVVPDAPGRYRFVTIATDAPINAQAFEQARTGARDLARCVSALEKLLCAAQDGTRDLSTPRVGAWSATVSSAIVE